MIEITRHSLVIPDLPASLQGLVIAHLTDLHRSPLTSDRLLRHAIALANQLCPDLIVLTGDYVSNNPADIKPVAHILSGLHAPLGIYASLGNHDHHTDGDAVTHALTHSGIHMLVNHSVLLENSLRLVGLDDDRYHHTDVARAFSEVKSGEPTLVLAHNPSLVEQLSDRDCVVFSGHTHGGQIHLPLLTKRELRRIGAKHYRAGWYTVGKARVYVNRGLGRVGLPLRLFCRPEIAVFTLSS